MVKHNSPACIYLKYSGPWIHFIEALRDASLDNGDLDVESLHHLRHPHQYALNIDDDNHLFSLKQFLADQNASRQTYTDHQRNHNERYPDDPMLSFAQVVSKVEEWSGVVPIVSDMCPKFCIAYNAAYKDLEAFPICSSSRYDEFQLAISHGHDKVPAQQYYTMPLGPQLQAL
ncbi:hypothetical protein JB92DRAFT_2728038, partial [Gautieria morchelliformis]